MANILLVEPDYRSKFPPLGLMRLATFHKTRGDLVTFVRGCSERHGSMRWHRVYVSSLFTYELKRTVATIKYYRRCVESAKDLWVGGIGATLMPEYIKESVDCNVIVGPMVQPRIVGKERRPLAFFGPDYSILESVDWNYRPTDAYFARATVGCVRHCRFCAVPTLEPSFGRFSSISDQVRETRRNFGEKTDLVLLDNNVLAIRGLGSIIRDIRASGFEAGGMLNNRLRHIDFNQGIDARLVDARVVRLLRTIPLAPVRLAFDFDGIEKVYCKAVKEFANGKFREFTNYVMFNFNDTPQSLYHRLRVNVGLSKELGVMVSSFPMKYVPITDVNRRHIAKGWTWRYLRGVQCILQATHGVVTPSQTFFDVAFGRNVREFLEIAAMPDRYITSRAKYHDNEAGDWKRLYRRLTPERKEEFHHALEVLNRSRQRKVDLKDFGRFARLLEHYYPHGESVRCV